MGLQTAEGCDQRHSLGKAKPAFFQAVTDALDSSSVSNAYAWGRRLIQEYARFFRERAPGCEEYARFRAEFESEGDAKPADGEYYGISSGVPVPKGSINMWVAGRCVSTDPMVNGSLRDQPGCMLPGQAAGTTAAQHVKSGQSAATIDLSQLIKTLRDAGTKLPQIKTRIVFFGAGTISLNQDADLNPPGTPWQVHHLSDHCHG